MTGPPTSALEGAPANYEIEAEIGCDSLTIAYRAHRRDTGKPVCIRVVLPELSSDTIFIHRFLEAGGRAMRLDHPNIARVYEATRREQVTYLVHELILDRSVADWVEQGGPLLPMRAVAIINQLAAALDYAHSRRLMHGHLNDRCVYIADNGRVTITDFGLVQAALSLDPTQQPLDRLRAVIDPRTWAYLAPERLQGQGPSRAADIYALGMLAYCLLAGALPPLGDAEAIADPQGLPPPPALDALNPELPSSLNAAVMRALARRPELRYNTATEFARAFAAAAKGIAPEHAPALTGRRPLRLRVRRLYWIVVGLPLLLGLIAAITWAAWQLGQPAAEPGGETPLTQAVAQASVEPLPSAPSPGPAPVETLPPATDTPTPSPSPTPSPVPPTPTPMPSPGAPVVTQGSPFHHLILARAVKNNQPVDPGDRFPAGIRTIYLFFDYRNMAPGTAWTHVWLWDNRELGRTDEKWPDDYGATGTAYRFFNVQNGYQPGAYQVQLLVNDQVVASASFVVE